MQINKEEKEIIIPKRGITYEDLSELVNAIMERGIENVGRIIVTYKNPYPTNGDIIKAMFPNAHDWIVRNTIEGDAVGEDEVSHFLELPNNLIINRFTEDWWNAPYEVTK